MAVVLFEMELHLAIPESVSDAKVPQYIIVLCEILDMLKDSTHFSSM